MDNKFTGLLAENAFGAYIIHILFVILAQITVPYIGTNASIKFIIAYSIALLCSFIAAYLLRKVPFVRRIV
jgi:predicted ATPase